MTNEEVAALAAAFRQIIEERDLAQRADIANLRADIDAEKVKSAEYRRLQSQSQQQMLKAMGDAVIEAVVPRLQQLQHRTADLEQRAMPAGATQ